MLFMKLFLLFIIYSFIGWCIEVVVMKFHTKKWINRGFLIGPYCPIYGVSAILMLILLQKYRTDLAALFVMSVLICSVCEYITSYLLEKIFNARWWDYSHMRFNVNGRICLSNSVLFGLLGVLLIKYINPFFSNFLNMIPNVVITILTIIISIIFITDLCISTNVIKKIKLTTSVERKDYTTEINEIVKRKLQKKSILINRIFNSFPNIQSIKKKSSK